jgi:hypothetical protein
MKYIDTELSQTNRALLDAWIGRRMSGAVFQDARGNKERTWWEMRQGFLRAKGAPMTYRQQCDAWAAHNSLNSATPLPSGNVSILSDYFDPYRRR